jgi:hypothetical protein
MFGISPIRNHQSVLLLAEAFQRHLAILRDIDVVKAESGEILDGSALSVSAVTSKADIHRQYLGVRFGP